MDALHRRNRERPIYVLATLIVLTGVASFVMSGRSLLILACVELLGIALTVVWFVTRGRNRS